MLTALPFRVQDSVDRVNWLNAGLMVVACAAAAVAPFHLFLVSYAVLGPLHYLTEISWLHDRQYFSVHRRRRRVWLVLVGLAVMVMAYGFVRSDLLNRPAAPVYEIGLFYVVFATAAICLYVRHAVNVVAAAAIAIVGVGLLSTKPAYGIAAYLLITIVHVFVFTGVFLLYGATKTNSRTGYLSFVVFVACAAATLLISAPIREPGPEVRSMYEAFSQLNAVLLRLFGRAPGAVYSNSAIGVMRFIAFAYTYHYLNWFSKTSIIGWNQISRGRAAGIVGAWIGGVALYAYSYRAGFAVFYVLSALHVMLEFPLNHQSFVGLARTGFGRLSAIRHDNRIAS
jgi:hypothetical protein